ncbi:hypothetical protein Tco_0853945 [Tanacetum coccineum]
MGEQVVWVPPFEPVTPEEKWRFDLMLDEGFSKMLVLDEKKLEYLEKIIEERRAALTEPPKPFTPTPVIFTPNTVVALSAHTCVTRSEDAIYYNIANVLDNSVFKILDPATGVADDAFKASIIKHYRRKKNSAASGITHEVPGASLLKSPTRI